MGDSGTILRTTNGGASWTRQSSSTTNDLYGISFTDANTGTAVGYGGTILRTTNGGASWTRQSSGTMNWLYDVCFTDANTGTVVGACGTILRTTNAGVTFVEEPGSRVVAPPFALHQNYPNPFNPSTTITYVLPKSSAVRLTIYDVLGREVSVLVDERRNAGVHEVKFDASGLSSGVYFYRLRAGDFVETKTLLLVR